MLDLGSLFLLFKSILDPDSHTQNNTILSSFAAPEVRQSPSLCSPPYPPGPGPVSGPPSWVGTPLGQVVLLPRGLSFPPQPRCTSEQGGQSEHQLTRLALTRASPTRTPQGHCSLPSLDEGGDRKLPVREKRPKGPWGQGAETERGRGWVHREKRDGQEHPCRGGGAASGAGKTELEG